MYSVPRPAEKDRFADIEYLCINEAFTTMGRADQSLLSGGELGSTATTRRWLPSSSRRGPCFLLVLLATRLAKRLPRRHSRIRFFFYPRQVDAGSELAFFLFSSGLTRSCWP